ncbi:dihydrofolate reductase DfrA [Mucilaginibacter koreensis]
MTNISIVVAKAQNNAIGKDNQLLWHLPADLKHFKDITSGHTIIMGRKTYDSIGRALPNRRNIVVTRQPLQLNGCEVVSSLNEALKLCSTEAEAFIIGGAQIYKQALPATHRIYLTEIHQEFEADTFFPAISPAEWNEIGREDFEPNEKNPLPYSFITLERR